MANLFGVEPDGMLLRILNRVDELCLMPINFLQLVAFPKHFVDVSPWLCSNVFNGVSIEADCLEFLSCAGLTNPYFLQKLDGLFVIMRGRSMLMSVIPILSVFVD